MIRWRVTLTSPRAVAPPGWTLYGQEITLGSGPGNSLSLPLAPSGDAAHLYMMSDELYGRRLSRDLSVAMNGHHLTPHEELHIPHECTLAIGPHLFHVTAEQSLFTPQEYAAALSCHKSRVQLRWHEHDEHLADLPDWGSLLLGRGPAAHISFSHETVSRSHGTIWAEGGSYYLTTIAPASLNGHPVKGRTLLTVGEKLTLGEITAQITTRAQTEGK